MSDQKISDRHMALVFAKVELADIFVSLTGTDPNDEQAFAEFCAQAEGILEDWMETQS
jgi:hypothetical protein